MKNNPHKNLYIILGILFLLLLPALFFDQPAEEIGGDYSQDENYQNAVIFGRCAYSLARLLENKDPGLLEADYAHLARIMDPQSIGDPDAAATAAEVLELLPSLRREGYGRELAALHEKWLERALMSEIASPSAPDGDGRLFPQALATLIASGALATDYPRQPGYFQGLSGGLKPLDPESLEALDGLYRKVLAAHADRLSCSGAPSRLALDGETMKELLEIMKIGDPGQRHRQLKAGESKFGLLPDYWHGRALAAAEAAGWRPEAGSGRETSLALQKYGALANSPARDELYVGLLMMEAGLQDYSADELRRHLKLITNSGAEPAPKRFFAALLLMDQALHADAAEYLQENISQDQLVKPSRALLAEALAAGGDRGRLWRLLQQVMEDAEAGDQEKLRYLGLVSDEIVRQQFLPQVQAIKILSAPETFGPDGLVLRLPSSWKLGEDEMRQPRSRLTIGLQSLRPVKVALADDGQNVNFLFRDDLIRQGYEENQTLELTFDLATEAFPIRLKGRLATDGAPAAGDPPPGAPTAQDMVAEAVAGLGLDVQTLPHPSPTPAPRLKTKPTSFVLDEVSTTGSCWRLAKGDLLRPCGP